MNVEGDPSPIPRHHYCTEELSDGDDMSFLDLLECPFRSSPSAETVEMFAIMKKKADSVPRLVLPCHYLRRRESVFAELDRIASEVSLPPKTTYKSMALIDRLRSKLDNGGNDDSLLIRTALFLAAKTEDTFEVVPPLEALLLNTQFKASDLVSYETRMLEILEWQLNPVTVFDIWAFLSETAHFDGEEDSLEMASQRIPSETEYIVQNFLTQCESCLLDLVVSDNEFLAYSTALLGMSCIAAAREAVTIKQLWPARLELLTGVTYECMEHCVEKVSEAFFTKFKSSILARQEALQKTLVAHGVAEMTKRKRKRSNGITKDLTSRLDM